MDHGDSMYPSCGSTTDTHMVPGSSSGLDVTIAPGHSADHSDWHISNSSVGLRHQHGTQVVSETSGIDMPLMVPLMVLGATDINRDSGCSRVVDPEMDLSSSSDLDDTIGH